MSDLGFHVPEVSSLTWLCPVYLGPQELAEAQAALQVRDAELCQAQNRQEEFLQRLWEAQEREAAAASQIQALNSQLEEAWVVRREVGDDNGKGSSKCWESMSLAPAVAGYIAQGLAVRQALGFAAG